MIDHSLDILVAQEHRCDESAIASMRKMFHGHGFNVFNSPMERNVLGRPINGLLTFIRSGLTPSLVKDIPGVDPIRCLVVQINPLVSASESAPMLIANMHLRADENSDVRTITIDKLLMFANRSHAQMRMIGDWNTIHDEGPIQGPLLAGTLCQEDDNEIINESTRRDAGGEGRHIDFMLSTPGCAGNHGRTSVRNPEFINGVHQKQHSDHDLIYYSIDIESAKVWKWCKRKDLLDDIDQDVIDTRWSEMLDTINNIILPAIDNNDAETAWAALSDCGEHTLRKDNKNRGVPRSAVQPPKLKTNMITKGSYRPVLLRQLDNIIAKAKQAIKEPWNGYLLRNLSRNVEAVSRRLPDIGVGGLSNLPEFILLVSATSIGLANEFTDDGIRKWKNESQADVVAMQRFVCRDPIEQDTVVKLDGKNPRQRVEADTEPWIKLWTNDNTIDPATMVNKMRSLGWTQQPEQPKIEFHGADLQRRCKKVVKTAAAIDGWRAAHFAKLPDQFFMLLARIATIIFDHDAKIPEIWTVTRVALIPKKDGGNRPITVSAIAWRIIVSVGIQQLNPWIRRWVSYQIIGGVSNRGIEDLTARFDDDFDSSRSNIKSLTGASVDLKKFFDTLSAEACIEGLVFLGLPNGFATAMVKFYKNVSAYVANRTTCNPTPIRRIAGAVQGCAFSLLMALVPMQIWQHIMDTDHSEVSTGVCVDDRLLWILSDNDQRIQKLKSACEMTLALDNQFGLVHNTGKGYTFSTNTNDQANLDEQLAFIGLHTTEFKYVGAEYDTVAANYHLDSAISRDKLAKIDLRCKRIKMIAHFVNSRRHLLMSCVQPIYKWAGAWRSILPKCRNHIARSLELTLTGGKHEWIGRSHAAMWLWVLPFQLHPQFTCDWETITYVARRARRHCLDQSRAFHWGALPSVCARWGWTLLGDCKVSAPEGDFDLSMISKAAALNLAREGWKRWLCSQDPRMKHQVPGCIMVDDAHAKKMNTSCSWLSAWATIGSLVDYRTLKRYKIEPHRCRCRLINPTREHWMWGCGHNGTIPTHANMLEYKMGIPVMRRILTTAQVNLEDTVVAFQQWLLSSSDNTVATDGSSDANYGAGFGICADGLCLHNAVPGVDTTSWIAEMIPLWIVVRGCLLAGAAHRTLHILCDCNNLVVQFNELILHAANKTPLTSLPKWGFGWWDDIYKMFRLMDDHKITIEWMPSHGKLASWKPNGTTISATECRKLNDYADEGAKEGLKICLSKRKVQEHQRMLDNKMKRASLLLNRICLAAHQYLDDSPEYRNKLDGHAWRV